MLPSVAMTALGTLASVLPQQGWQAVETKTFQGESLYGHINGGSELFLEFGFERLDVRFYRKAQRTWTLELYHMESPLAGLGIYLAKCGKETPLAGIPERHTASPQQITALKGRCMVVLNNPGGTQDDLKAMVDLVNATMKPLPGEAPTDLFGELPQQDQVPGSRFLARGPLALQSVFSFGEGDFIARQWLAGADYRDAQGRVSTRMIMRCADSTRARATLAALMATLDESLRVVEKNTDHLKCQDDQGRTATVHHQDAWLRFDISAPRQPQ